MNQNFEIIKDFYNKHVAIEAPGGLMLGKAPGDRYSIQLYSAVALYNRGILQLICQEFERLVPEIPFQVAGREWSACPLITGIGAYNHRHGFMIRRKRKTYGLHNIVEGSYDPKLPVLLVDDVSNSTDSYAHCKRVCEQELGLTVLPYIFSVINKKYKGEKGWDKEKTIKEPTQIISILTLDDIEKWPRLNQ